MVNAKLKILIIEKFGSQADFAQHLGVSEPLVSCVVRHRKRLPWQERLRWANALNCRPQEIFSAN